MISLSLIGKDAGKEALLIVIGTVLLGLLNCIVAESAVVVKLYPGYPLIG